MTKCTGSQLLLYLKILRYLYNLLMNELLTHQTLQLAE